jgi:dienelactone hydrolase
MRRALTAPLIALLILATGVTFGAVDDETSHHDVAFVSNGVTLRGTVFLPVRMPAFAALVWIDGAGKTPRNPGLAHALASRGISVLTYDKRGAGRSGGVYAGPEVGTNNVSAENLVLLAHDAAAALHALRQEKKLRDVSVGFLGASQAGWIIPAAALERREARFMVFWSGAVETTHQNLLFERTAGADKDFWDHHTHDDVRKIMNGVADDLDWASLDPRPALASLSIPGHWMFGGRDRNVDVGLSMARLDDLVAAGHSNYSYRVFAGYDHWLGGKREDVFAPTVAWIHEVAQRTH